MLLREALDPAERVEPQELVGYADRNGAGSAQAIGEAGEQRLQRPQPARQQRVQVAALGHTCTCRRMARQPVAFDDRDPLEVAAERLRGSEAAHAGAEHDGVIVARRAKLHHGGHSAPRWPVRTSDR